MAQSASKTLIHDFMPHYHEIKSTSNFIISDFISERHGKKKISKSQFQNIKSHNDQ